MFRHKNHVSVFLNRHKKGCLHVLHHVLSCNKPVQVLLTAQCTMAQTDFPTGIQGKLSTPQYHRRAGLRERFCFFCECKLWSGKRSRCIMIFNSPLSQRKRKWSCCAGSWGRMSCILSRNCSQRKDRTKPDFWVLHISCKEDSIPESDFQENLYSLTLEIKVFFLFKTFLFHSFISY